MTAEANLAIVQGVYKAFGRGDLATILNQLAEDIDWAYPGPSAIPFAGTWRGHDQVRRFFAALMDAVDVQAFEVQRFVAQDDLVVVLGGERMRVKATGRSYETQWAHVFTLHQGRVVGFREYANTAAVAEAFREPLSASQ